MISRLTLTAVLLAFATMTSAQRPSQRAIDAFKGKTPTAKERGLDARTALAAYSAFIKDLPENGVTYAKSSSAFAARLDSAVSPENLRAVFAHDDNGNNTLEQYYMWEFPGLWLPFDQIETAYNGDNLPVDRMLSAYDDGAMEMVPYDRETFSYLEGGLVDEVVRHGWDGSQWLELTKASHAYGEDGILTEVTFYTWDYVSEAYSLTSKDVYTYNASGGLTERLRLFWIDSDWVNSTRLAYTLNASNDVILEEFAFWQNGQEAWTPLTSNAYTYNAAGLLTEVIYAVWNVSQEIFVPEARDLSDYDNIDRLTAEEFFYWNSLDSLWMNLYLDTYAYDEDSNVAAMVYHSWDADAGEYVSEGMETLTYNNDYPSENIMAPEWYREFAKHMLLSSTYAYNDMGVPTEEQSIDYYYTLLDALAAEEADKASFAVSPNPFRESIILRAAEEIRRFTLYDLQGRVILQKQIAGAREVHPGQLPAGMYVYQIDGINSRQTGKLVKE